MQPKVTTVKRLAQYGVTAAREEKLAALSALCIGRYIERMRCAAAPFAIDEIKAARVIGECFNNYHESILGLTRSAAAAHEVGHFVVAHVNGLKPQNCEIKEFQFFGKAGYLGTVGLSVNMNSIPSVAALGRVTLAGPVAERYFLSHDLAGRISELVEARVFVSRAAVLSGQDREKAWTEAILEVLNIFDQIHEQIAVLTSIVEAQGALPFKHAFVRAFLENDQFRPQFIAIDPSEAALEFVKLLDAVPDVLREVRS